MGKMNLT
jgi:transposase